MKNNKLGFKKGYTPWNKGMKGEYSVNSKEKHPRWKGGKSYRTEIKGYIFVKQENGRYKAEHRIIMEKHLGRKLRKDEVIHHINRKTNDNRIKNLQILKRKEHSARGGNSKLKLECPKCKHQFTIGHK